MNKQLANKIFENKVIFNQGKRGIIFKSKLNDKIYLIKQRKKRNKPQKTCTKKLKEYLEK